MQKAKEYGCESFVLFSNTPPVYYTYNGQARSDKGAFSNLKTEHYGDFADFLATCAKHFVDEGYNGMAMNKKVRPGRIQKWQR